VDRRRKGCRWQASSRRAEESSGRFRSALPGSVASGGIAGNTSGDGRRFEVAEARWETTASAAADRFPRAPACAPEVGGQRLDFLALKCERIWIGYGGTARRR